MKTKKLMLKESEENQLSLRDFLTGKVEAEGLSEEKRLERMGNVLRIGMEHELTERQRQCIDMRYMKNMKAEEIADALSLSVATVYKHLRKGIHALKHCVFYL